MAHQSDFIEDQEYHFCLSLEPRIGYLCCVGT